MAKNFRIRKTKKSNRLHIHLAGDFDGTSALELIQTLKKNEDAYSVTYVHTQGLSHIHKFGIAVFKNRFRGASPNRFIFTGQCSSLMVDSETQAAKQ